MLITVTHHGNRLRPYLSITIDDGAGVTTANYVRPEDEAEPYATIAELLAGSVSWHAAEREWAGWKSRKRKESA